VFTNVSTRQYAVNQIDRGARKWRKFSSTFWQTDVQFLKLGTLLRIFIILTIKMKLNIAEQSKQNK